MAGVLGRRWPGLDLVSLALALAVALAAAAAAGAVTWLAWTNVGGLVLGPARLSLLLRLVLATGAGGLVYVGASRLLRIPELGTITGVVTDLVRRRR
jgi:hypothetical protein